MKFSEAKNKTMSEGQYWKAVDGDNVVRIVSEGIFVWKAFAADKTCDAVFLTEEGAKVYNKSQTDKARHAKQKLSVYVINRSNQQIQIAEFGSTIYSSLGTLQETPKYNFETVPPYDVIINKKGSGMETEYSLLPDRGDTPLTEDEKQKISELEPLLSVWMKDAVDADKVALDVANSMAPTSQSS